MEWLTQEAVARHRLSLEGAFSPDEAYRLALDATEPPPLTTEQWGLIERALSPDRTGPGTTGPAARPGG